MQDHVEGLQRVSAELLAELIQAKINLIPLAPNVVRLTRGEVTSLMQMHVKIVDAEIVSSNVSRLGKDVAARVIKVIFKNGTEYRYLNVPLNLIGDMDRAESKGRFISMLKGLCAAVKVTPEFYTITAKLMETHGKKEADHGSSGGA